MIMNDLEWPMLSYYVIYYEKFRKVMLRTEKEALTWVWIEFGVHASKIHLYGWRLVPSIVMHS